MNSLGALLELLGASQVRAVERGAHASPAPPGVAQAIVSPEDIEQVQALLAWARSTGTILVPMGSGRHFEHRPWPEGVVLVSSEKLSGIAIYESADLTLTAGAGTRIADLGKTVADASQWLPFDPPDADERSLGGLIAAGRAGPVWAGYGALRNHVLGATVVCGDGRVLRLGGRVVKNVAGFDLLRPMVGSRGSLGLIVSATVRLFPKPAVDRFLTFRTTDLPRAVGVLRALATGPVRSASAVMVGDSSSHRILLRLQGAERTVVADRAALEAHAGVDFEEVADPDAVLEHETARDLAWSDESVLQASALPASLGRLLDRVAALPDARFVADGHAGSVRVAFDGGSADTEAAVATLREEVESSRGSVRWLRGPVGAEVSLTSGPSGAVRELEEGVKKIFDPTGVFPALPR